MSWRIGTASSCASPRRASATASPSSERSSRTPHRSPPRRTSMKRADRVFVVLSTALLLAACGGEEKDEPAVREDSPAPVATEEAGDPTPVVTEHGETYFGVYLAVGEG